MGSQFTDLTPEGKRYFAKLKKLSKMEIRVGFQSATNAYKDGTDLIDVAAFNEFGTSDIPARPFMRQSFENHEDKLEAAGRRANNALARGDSVEQVLKRTGVAAKGLIQKEIREGEFVPNKPSTVSKKGSDQPLIDTGHMRQSVRMSLNVRG